MQLYELPQRVMTLGDHHLDLGQPHVMGILNVTPDSFSDGGRFVGVSAALAQAERMLHEGATLIDVGGESTRPHAQPVGEAEEHARVVPVVAALVRELGALVSVDTSTPRVFEAAADQGAALWNDVRALRREGARALVARLGLPVVLMHSRGEPDTMTDLAAYGSVTFEVIGELDQAILQALEAGIKPDQLIVDVGFGFAKTPDQNLTLLNELSQVQVLGYPMLVGLSRKRVLGHVLRDQEGHPASVEGRINAGVAAAVLAVQQGASIVRTHDVQPTVEALRLWRAVNATHAPSVT